MWNGRSVTNSHLLLFRFFSEIEEYVAWCFQHHEQHFGGETPKPPVELTQARLEAIKLALRRMPVSGWYVSATNRARHRVPLACADTCRFTEPILVHAVAAVLLSSL